MDKEVIRKHYEREEVQEAMANIARHREIAVRYTDYFGRRPDIIQYPADVKEFAKQGATSFHFSEERWHDPMMIQTGMRREEMNELRSGWDLLLDLDCDYLEYSKITADMLIKALHHMGINNVQCKFSGRSGFHIAVPVSAFPESIGGEPTSNLFPDAARAIAEHLTDLTRDHLRKLLLQFDPIDQISKNTGRKVEELLMQTPQGKTIDPFEVVKVDPIAISSRHLLRMPYSFNEKSGLISVPIDPRKVLEFDLNQAKPENISFDHPFLDQEEDYNAEDKAEARHLLLQSLDNAAKKKRIEDEQRAKKRQARMAREGPTEAIPEECFPPCIRNILAGLRDGKKRAMFVATNFLSSVGWSQPQIEELIIAWNKKNPEPLRQTILLGHLRHHENISQDKDLSPPNCNNLMYYKDLQICTPDHMCKRIKNPAQYASRQYFIAKRLKDEEEKEKEKQEKRKIREQKEKERIERYKKKMAETSGSQD